MKTDYQNKIITKLKRLREDNECSQAELAKIVGISCGQIGNIESFKQPHKYKIEHIYKICKKFNVTVCDIFADNEELNTEQLIQKIIEYER